MNAISTQCRKNNALSSSVRFRMAFEELGALLLSWGRCAFYGRILNLQRVFLEFDETPVAVWNNSIR